MKNTFKQVMCSVLALVMTLSALLGTTFAWFTDSVTSNGNIIQSGKLSAEMHWSDKLLAADSDEWNNADGASVFNYKNWEPGYTEIRYVKVSNSGTLNFKWKLSIEAEGKVTDLSDVIDVYYVNPVTAELTKESLKSLAPAGTLTEVLASNSGEEGSLAPDACQILAIAFHMDELAGNDYQGKSLCEAGFALKLLATQDVGEFDSFDDQYDVDAEWPYSSIKYSVSQSIAEVIDTATGSLTEDVTIGEATDDQYAEIPSDVKLADGAESLTLKIESMEKPKADVTATTSKEVVRSVDVHIDGVAEDNTVPMLVTLKALFPVGIMSNNVRLYHVENGATNEMTLVNNPVNHNEFSHDANTGDVVIAVASFSEIATIADTANAWNGTDVSEEWYTDNTAATEFTLMNAADFAGFRDLVDGGNTFAGKTIKLGSNINLGGKNFDPIGWGYDYKAYNRDNLDGKTFKGTFDGAGHIISNLYQNGWDLEAATGTDYTYTNCGGGLFAAACDATIKDLTIMHANIKYECVEAGIVVGLAQGNCTFENIEIYDSKIANYQRPAGGVVGEVSPAYNETNGWYGTHNFNNIVIDTSVTVGSMWGDFDTPVGGVIGARWDDENVSKVVMENVNVACKLDVYNDVTSTYQWYAYRRAGMLIGNTDTPPADGKNSKVATADFLTCTNVKVYYGNWTKYNYCQFTNHNSSWPWVRVQPGDNCNAYSNPRYGVPNDPVTKQPVTSFPHNHAEGDQCNLELQFNQLYGGGQGVYGQPEHDGVTFVKYIVTFMHDDHVAGIEFVTDNSKEYTVSFPKIDELESNEYNWINYIGNTVTPGSEKIAAGNIRDVFYYVNETDYYYARFVDKDGIQIDAIKFDPKKGTFLDGLTAPDVPEIPGYNGIWEPYTLQGATADLIIDPVYTKGDITDTEILTMTTAKQLFELLSKGKSVAMSQDLTGEFKSASDKTFCTVVGNPVSGSPSTEARFDLNSFELSYDCKANGNQPWTLFHVLNNCKLTVGSGIAGYGVLKFEMVNLNSGSHPVIFELDAGATLVLERGVVIEFVYPTGHREDYINPFVGVTGWENNANLKIEQEAGITRITVLARTVLVGDGSN